MSSLEADLLAAAKLVEDRDCDMTGALVLACGVIEGPEWMARVGTMRAAMEQHLGAPVTIWDNEPDVTWMHRAAALRAAAKQAGRPEAVKDQ